MRHNEWEADPPPPLSDGDIETYVMDNTFSLFYGHVIYFFYTPPKYEYISSVHIFSMGRTYEIWIYVLQTKGESHICA